jgi:hypothetical protein
MLIPHLFGTSPLLGSEVDWIEPGIEIPGYVTRPLRGNHAKRGSEGNLLSLTAMGRIPALPLEFHARLR